MPLFTPTIVFERITCITPEFLGARGLRALILDVDNTLTAHGSQELPPDVAAWLDTMRAAGVKLTIASNNMPGRVAPFAKRVGLEYQAFCCKPSPFGLRRARRAMGVSRREVALVGDQIFTDVFGGNRMGALTCYVQTLDRHFFWINVRLKNPCWRGIIKKAGVSTEKRKTANHRTHRSVPAANTGIRRLDRYETTYR